MADQLSYDSDGQTDPKAVVSATKIWAVALAAVVLLGILMMAAFVFWGSGANNDSGPVSSENTATRPAEP